MPPAKNHSNRPLAGIVAIVSGLFLFSLQDLVIKHFSGDYSVLQIVVTRGVVATLLVAAVVGFLLGAKGFVVRSPGLILGKGLLAFWSYLAFYLAVASMPLADVVAITFTAPIFVTVMSALLLGKSVGIRRWLAVMVGFAGALLVVGPGGQTGNIAVAFAGMAALTYAVNSIIARYIGPEDKPWTVTFYFTVAHLLGGVLVSLTVAAFGFQLEADHPSLAFLLRPWSFGSELDLMLMGALGINALNLADPFRNCYSANTGIREFFESEQHFHGHDVVFDDAVRKFIEQLAVIDHVTTEELAVLAVV